MRHFLLRLALTSLNLVVLNITPQTSLAHQVELSTDVGATLHIEPDDTPKAGEVTEIWFALTRKGGQSIPLAACDCALAVYATPAEAQPILEPPLNPVSAEGYADIPGAQFTFPTVGAYELVLTGQPQTEKDFAPFELRFDVLVAAGSALKSPTQPEAQSKNPSDNGSETIASSADLTLPSDQRSPRLIALITGGAIALLAMGIVLWRRRSQ
ncbi:MAG: hypothetical protein F6J87_02085 [Spirulina sp. SIO3F2]|nr:hypothetical protein [Spirulina sp. SIO3F2]